MLIAFDTLLISVAGLLIVLILIAWLWPRRPDYPYQKRTYLMTEAERQFLIVLDEAAGPTCRIFGPVRLIDIVNVADHLDKLEQRRARSLIIARHLDFVICRHHDLHILCAVELDGCSHQHQEHQAEDDFVNDVMEAAELPLLRFSVHPLADISSVQKRLHSIGIPEAKESKLVKPVISHDPDVPQCPACQSSMHLMKGRRGGKAFWGCSGYPHCRTTLPYEDT